MNQSSPYAAQATALVREYAPGRGVSGVSFAVESGVCFALLGKNGSGKSTLARLLLGLDRPSSGTLTVLGVDVGGGARAHLSRLGATLDTDRHWEDLAGWENAYFVARSYGLPPGEIDGRLGGLFDLADLGHRAHDAVRTYSYGMRRKLTLIEAFCHDPDFLILDEPTAGLDAHFLLKLADLVHTRTGAGLTTWISGNDADWIEGVAEHVALMDSGRIIWTGSKEALLREVAGCQEIHIRLGQASPISRPPFEDLRSFYQDGLSIKALINPDPLLVPRVMEWIISEGGAVRAVEVRRTTLRDAFLLKTGQALEE